MSASSRPASPLVGQPAAPTASPSLAPGLILAAAVAAAAFWLGTVPWFRNHGLSTLTLAIAIGMLVGNTVYPKLAARAGHGIGFSKTKLLRAGIVLYGMRLTFGEVASIGVSGVLVDVIMLSSTYLAAYWIGTRVLGLDRETSLLIGAGSSICGAAAVMAAEPVVKGRAEQATIAVATVVAFGTLAMFLWPAIYHLGVDHGLLQWSAREYGVFVGSTVHEVAQVVVAGGAVSQEAADAAVVTKMLRVMMLAPVLVVVALLLSRGSKTAANGQAGRTRITVPWFAFGFIAVAAFNSLVDVPASLKHAAITVDDLLLAMAMAALGLTTHVSTLRRAGTRPMWLASMLFGWLLVGGLVVNHLIGQWAR
ncbi:MAG: YeiH family putative sulfate export transporter [Proteobacteria bacterium]|nr:YeiH family putative sulfate export transporter [Pseudomonadota bacterium]